jgi:hypothetical protein
MMMIQMSQATEDEFAQLFASAKGKVAHQGTVTNMAPQNHATLKPLNCTETTTAHRMRVKHDCPAYVMTYKLLNAFERQNIDAHLVYGTFLGAERHHGIIPFLEKDVDIAVFTDNEKLVESIIHQTSTRYSRKSFGYHIPVPLLQQYYIDIWLNERRNGEVRCIGRLNGTGCDSWYKDACGSWCAGGERAPVYRESDWFPLRQVKFGREKANVPKTTAELDLTYGDWRQQCGEAGPCAPLRDKYEFSSSPSDRALRYKSRHARSPYAIRKNKNRSLK